MKWHSIFHYTKLSINCLNVMCVCGSVCVCVSQQVQQNSRFILLYIHGACFEIEIVRFCNDKICHSSRPSKCFNGVSFASCFWHECAHSAKTFCTHHISHPLSLNIIRLTDQLHIYPHTCVYTSNLVENYSNEGNEYEQVSKQAK